MKKEKIIKKVRASNQWKLSFESKLVVERPTFKKIVAAIENLDAKEEKCNSWIILEWFKSDGVWSGFVQTACVEPGLYIVELRLNYSKDGERYGFWKAGQKSPSGAIVHPGKNGLYKTFENERLETSEVISIFEHFYLHQKRHPDFKWRSERKDLEATRPKS